MNDAQCNAHSDPLIIFTGLGNSAISLRKWVNFEDVDPSDGIAERGISDCQSSRNYIMSLNNSFFQGFKPKKVNKSS